MKLSNKILGLIYLSIFYAVSLYGVAIVPQRYSFNINGVNAKLPYKSNYSLSMKNRNITKLIIAIHSSNYSAEMSFNNINLLSKKMGKNNTTLIVAPQFIKSSLLKTTQRKNFLFWDNAPFLGSSNARYFNRKVKISAYEIIDNLIDNITKYGNFPKLQEVIIYGHSAGGQFVNRYCAYNRFDKFGLDVRYIIMAPSSYLYFNKERAIKGLKNRFKIPKAKASTYNNWGYGMDKLYQVHRRNRVTASKMSKQYLNSEVIYLVGSRDNNVNGRSLSKTKASMFQGKHRVERAIIYYNYLQHYFGKRITRKHNLHIIKNIGHSSKGLMNSKVGKNYLFGQ